jgi:hypothetical protein
MDDNFLFEVNETTQHEDGSVTFQIDIGVTTAKIFTDAGIQLVLLCAAAGISVPEVFDMIHKIADERVKEADQPEEESKSWTTSSYMG